MHDRSSPDLARQHGEAESASSPHPLFDPHWYAQQNPDLPPERATFGHYLTEGWRNLKSPHPLFSVEYYFEQRPDVKAAGLEPLTHFMTRGWKEGANPHPEFDVGFYLSRDHKLHNVDPLTHYLTDGSWQGRCPNKDFDPVRYLQANSGAREAGMEALTYFVVHDQAESRTDRAFKADPLTDSAERSHETDNTLYDWLVRRASTKGVVQSNFVNAGKMEPRVVAFYLPQYHRVKENDEFWGEGFTEWTNVRKARPNFEDHYQPRIPENENYYDLANIQVQERQTRLAKEYGVNAFCYYLYWFNGRRVLERPLDQMLANHGIDMEFCVCWANENWTRTWDGKQNDILLGQVHTPESDRQFIRDAMKYLADPRYMRVDGRLMLLVYRADLIPHCSDSMAIWREEVRRAGLGELHLCAVQFYGITDPEPWGFDAAVEFPPHGWLRPELKPDHPPQLLNPNFKGHIFDYTKSVDFALSKPIPDYRWYRGVFPGWDNTARRQDTPHIFAGTSAFQFERWLTETLRQTAIMAPPEHQIIFINAWNEWGEGAHLEPDMQTGRLNLMALNSALSQIRREDNVMKILGRLRRPGAYAERDQDERALLNYLKGREQSLRALSTRLHELSNLRSN